MARVVWSEPALSDLLAVADYIALENPLAAARLVRRIYERVGQLAEFPCSGPRPPELAADSRYRQLLEGPCRIFYRAEADTVVILHLMRSERVLRPEKLVE